MTDRHTPAEVTRRTFVVGASAVLGAGALGVVASRVSTGAAVESVTAAGHSMAGMAPMAPTALASIRADALQATGGGGFVEPEVRASRNGELATTFRVARTPVLVGTETIQAITYEGLYPGPTLDVRAGDTLKVKLVNDDTEPTNLHMHGFHVSPSGSSDNVLLSIAPGETFDYEYDIPDDHPAGTYWYHSHLHMLSDKQVFGGLFGLVVIRGDIDDLPDIAGLPERVMVLSQIEIVDGEVVNGSDSPLSKQATLVNGQYQPVLEIASGEVQRWRICNSASTFYRLQVTGHELHVVNVDGNTPTETVTTDVLIVPPGGRADVLVRGGEPGSSTLDSISWADLGAFYIPNMVPVPQTLVRLETTAGATPSADVALPTALLPMTDLRSVPIDRRREFRLSEREPRGVGPNDKFRYFINETEFDHDVVNETMILGTTEEWEIINLTYEPHPFHIHVNPFQIITINGEPSGEDFYRDSALVPPFGRIVIRHQFLDYTGKYVMHCHILFHEDHGMMQLLEVVEPD